MHIQIQQKITSADWQSLTDWAEQVFPEEGRDLQWGESSHHIVARDTDGKAVGHIGVGQFALTTTLGTRYVLGVGGVVVRPEYQGQRLPEKLFSALHTMPLDAFQTQTFALFCPFRLVDYYRRHGYQPFEHAVVAMDGDTNRFANFCFMTRGNIDWQSPIQLQTLPW